MFSQKSEIKPGKDYNLYSFEFSDIVLDDDATCQMVMRMFLDLGMPKKFGVPYDVSPQLQQIGATRVRFPPAINRVQQIDSTFVFRPSRVTWHIFSEYKRTKQFT